MIPFISTDDLGFYLRRDFADDDLSIIACNAACDAVRSFTEQRLNFEADEVIRLNGTGTDALLLPELPVIELFDVFYPGLGSGDDDTEIVGWKLDLEEGIIYAKAGRVWKRGRQNIEVVYSHGYAVGVGSGEDAPEFPDDLRIVALKAAARLYDQGLAQQESVGGYQIVYSEPDFFSKVERAIMTKYKRRKRAA